LRLNVVRPVETRYYESHLAIDLSIDGPLTATVNAIDRVEHGITRHSEIAELSASQRQIPLVACDQRSHAAACPCARPAR
jgi:hypothetical protein